jgi:hypothetical protein
MMKIIVLNLLFFSLLLLFISCAGDTSGKGGLSFPIINSFTASPGSLWRSGTVTLSWSVNNADSVSIDEGIGSVSSSGSKDVSIEWTKGIIKFTLTAVNSDGSRTAEANLRVYAKSWVKTYGGYANEAGNSVQQTLDGGYIVIGSTRSFGAGAWDIYLLKLDASGNISWEKTLGGRDWDRGNSVQQTSDGGYVVAGQTRSFGAGKYDVYLSKTDRNGNQLWEKTFGGAEDDAGHSVLQVSDGGYIILGYTESFGSGSSDVYLIKTNALGDMEWEKVFGGEAGDWGWSVKRTADNGFIIAGTTKSFGVSVNDIYLVKTDSFGDLTWQKTIGDEKWDGGYSVQQTSDGGYIIAGDTYSIYSAKSDVFLLKTNGSGTQSWFKIFGDERQDRGKSVLQTDDGGYFIVGAKEHYNDNSFDVYLIKTNSSGDLEWEMSLGEPLFDHGQFMSQTSDGGLIIVGRTTSWGDVNGDILLEKIE